MPEKKVLTLEDLQDPANAKYLQMYQTKNGGPISQQSYTALIADNKPFSDAPQNKQTLGPDVPGSAAFWENERKAINQRASEKWANGLAKFTEQAASGVFSNVVNLVYGTFAAVRDQSFSSWYDNEFTRMVDGWDEATKAKFVNYSTREYQNKAFYQQMLGPEAVNFWADDVLGGMAFTVSVVATELLLGGIGGMMAPARQGLQANRVTRQIAKTAKALNGVDDAVTAVSTVNQAAGKLSTGAKIGDAALFARRMYTGAMYEAGVEARHYKDEAWMQVLDTYGYASKEEMMRKDPKTYADIESSINGVGNSVFAGNVAIVGLSNFITLGKTFGKGFSKSKAISTKPMSPTRIVHTKGPASLAWDNWTKGRKLAYYTGAVVKRPLAEGLWEEGGQGLVNKAGLNYIAAKYDPDGANDVYGFMDAMSDAFADTYGNIENNQFWKEVSVGMIIGALGSPTLTSANVFKDGWQGSSLGAARDLGKRISEARVMLDKALQSGTLERSADMIKTANSVLVHNRKENEAYRRDDAFSEKNASNTAFYTMMEAKYKVGMANTVEDEISKQIAALSDEEYVEMFGYGDNLTKEEIATLRKDDIADLKKRAKASIKSIEFAEDLIRNKSYIVDDERNLTSQELISAVGYNHFMTTELDRRESQMYQALAESTSIDSRSLEEVLRANEEIKTTEAEVNELKKLRDELKMAQKNLEVQENTSEETDIEKLNTELEQARKDVRNARARYNRRVKKEYEKRVKHAQKKGTVYDRNFEEFEKTMQDTIGLVEALDKAYFDNPDNGTKLKAMVKDLGKIAKQRELYITDIRNLTSPTGSARFARETEQMREVAARAAREKLFESFKMDLHAMGLSEMVAEANKEAARHVEEDTSIEFDELKVDQNENEFVQNVKNTLNKLGKDLKTQTQMENYATYLKKVKKDLKGLKEGVEDSEYGEAQKAEYEALEAIVDSRLAETETTIETKKENKKNSEILGTDEVLNKPESFVRFIPKDEEGKDTTALVAALATEPNEEVIANLEVVVEPWEGAATMSDPADGLGNPMDTDVRIQSGFVHNEQGYAIRVKYKGQTIGALTSPTKFFIGDTPLNYADPEQVMKLNRGFTDVQMQQLAHYQNLYYDMIVKALDSTIPFSELNDIVKLNIMISEPVSVNKDAGRRKIGQIESALITFENGKRGWILLGREKTLFLEAGQEEAVPVNNKTTPDIYREVIDITKTINNSNLPSHVIFESTNHSYYMVHPLPNGQYAMLGVDYPSGMIELTDTQLDDIYQTKAQEFNAISDSELNKRAKGKEIVVEGVPIVITLTRTGSVKGIGLDVEVPLIRRKMASGKWAPVQLGGTVKVSGPEGGRSYLNLGKTVTKDGQTEFSLTSYGSPTSFSVRGLKLVIEERLNSLLFKAEKGKASPGDLAVLSILTEGRTLPKGNVGVSRILPAAVKDDAANFELAMELGKATIATEPAQTPVFTPRIVTRTETELEEDTKEPVSEKPKEAKPTNNPDTADKKTAFNKDLNQVAHLNNNPLPHIPKGSKYDPNTFSPEEFNEIVNSNEFNDMLLDAIDEGKDITEAMEDGLISLKDRRDNGETFTPESTDDDVKPFSIEKYNDGTSLSIEEAKEELLKILPDSVSVEDIDKIAKNLKKEMASGVDVFGTFFKGVVYLTKGASKTLAYHEAFHVVYRALFNTAERADIMKKARVKYGKPTKAQIQDLKDLYAYEIQPRNPQYWENLWYEEQMADDFARHTPETKAESWWSKIVKTIKKWFNIVQDKTLEGYFNDIYAGKYKDAYVQNNMLTQAPAFVSFKGANNSYLTKRESEILISKVYLKVISDESGETLNSKIRNAMKEVGKELHPTNYVKYGQQSVLKARRMGSAFYLMGLRDENFKQLKTQIVNRLHFYSDKVIKANELNEQEEIENEQGDTTIFDKDIGEYEGIKSVSERVRLYLANTYYYNDFLELGLNEEEVLNEKNKISIQHYRIYDALVRGLADVSEEDFIGRFYYMSQSNPQIKAVFDRFVQDAYKELGYKQAFDITNKKDMTGSVLFRDFFNAFNNTKLNFVSVLEDVERRQFRVFNTNTKDVANQQLTRWNNLFTANMTASEAYRIGDKISEELYDLYYPKVLGKLPNSIDSRAKEVQMWLAANLGMDLHIDYVKWSIIRDNLAERGNFPSMTIQGNKYINNLAGLETAYKDLGHQEAIESLRKMMQFYYTYESAGNSLDQTFNGESLLFNVLPLVLKDKQAENRNPYAASSDMLEKDGTTALGKGAVTRIKNIAQANAVFDSTIAESTFRNNEGNMITDKVKNSFMSDMFRILKTPKFKDYLAKVSQADQTVTSENLKEILEENQIHYTDEFIELYHLSFQTNPLIAKSNLNTLLDDVDFRLTLIGGYRETSFDNDGQVDRAKDFQTGVEFKNMPPIEKARIAMVMYSDFKTRGKETFALFNLGVNEAKNINYLTRLPVNQFFVDGVATDTYKNAEYMLFLNEFYTIQRNFTTPSNITIKGYNDSEKGRGYKFFNFEFLPESIRERAIEAARAGQEIDLSLENEIKEALAKNAEDRIKKFADVLDDNDLRKRLPTQYVLEGGKGWNMDYLGNYVLNDYINAFSVNNMISINDQIGHKDLKDVIKRNAGKVAYGPSLGPGTTKFAVIKDYTHQGINGPVDKAADAQSYATPAWMINTYLQGLGKYRHETLEALTDFLVGIPLSDKHSRKLNKFNSLFNSRKLVGRDAQTYWKTSVHAVAKADIVEIDPKDYDKVRDIGTKILKGLRAGKDVTTLYEDLYSYYKPMDHRKELFDMYQRMELGGIDVVAFESAIKTSIINSNDYVKGKELNTSFEMSNRFIREQVNTDGFKETVIDPTQALQILWSEQHPDKAPIIKEFKELVAKRIKEGSISLKNTIFEKAPDGVLTKPLYKELYQVFQDSIESGIGDPYLKELFALDTDGKPIYDPNFPAIVSKFQSMFISYISARVFKHKVAGRKYTLVANYGYKVRRNAKGDVIPKGSKEKASTISELKYNAETGEAEVIISSYLFSKYADELKDNIIPPSLAQQLGIRIPTQDNHSVMRLKVVDILDSAMGSSIIVPTELIEISGADFDVDSLFAKIYQSVSGSKYGEYKNYASEVERIQRLITEITSSREFRENLEKEYKETISNLNINSIEEEAKERDMDVKDVYKERKDFKLFREKYLIDNKLDTVDNFKTSDRYSKFKNGEGPFTREELDNRMLDIQLELAHNDWATVPADTKPIQDAYEEMENAGISTAVESPGVYDAYSKFKFYQYAYAGKGGIGPAAIFNTVYQTLRAMDAAARNVILIKLEEGLSAEIEKVKSLYPGYEAVFNTDTAGPHRVNAVISAFVTAFTDNMKDFDAERSGISSDTVSSALVLVATGVPLVEVMAMFRTDAGRFYSDYLDKLIDEPFLEDKFNDRLANHIVKLYAEKYDNTLPSGTGREAFQMNKTNLLASLAEGADPALWYSMNWTAIQSLMAARKIAQEIRTFSAVTSLLRGVKKSTNNIDIIFEKLKQLGLFYTKEGQLKKIKKTKKVGDMIIRDEPFIDWFKVIKSNPYIEANLEALYDVKYNVLPKYLITSSTVGHEILEGIRNQGRTWRYTREDVNNKLLSDFNSYLLIKAFTHAEGQEYDLNKHLFNDKFYHLFEEVMEMSQDPSNRKLYNNKLLMQIRRRAFEYSKGSRYEGKKISWGEINTNTKRDPDTVVEILDGFNQLMDAGGKARELAINIMIQTIVKDNLKFKNNGLIRLIDPRHLKKYIISHLPNILEAMNNEEKFKSVFGLPISEISREFSELYLRNTNNFKEIRSYQDAGKFMELAKSLFSEVKAQHGIEDYKFKSNKEKKDFTPIIFTTEKGKDGNRRVTGFEINAAPGWGYVVSISEGKVVLERAQNYANPLHSIITLASSGLFAVGYKTIGKGDKARRAPAIEFPQVIKIDKSYYRLVQPELDEYGRAISLRGKYELTTQIGTRNFEPYAFSIEQHDNVIKEIAEMQQLRDAEERKMMIENTKEEMQEYGVNDINEYNSAIFRSVANALAESVSPSFAAKHAKEVSDLMNANKMTEDEEIDILSKTLTADQILEIIKRAKGTQLQVRDITETPEQYRTKKQLTNVLNKLSKKFGISWEFDENMPHKGRFEDNTVYINPKLYSKDTPFHEFGHALIDMLNKYNPMLFDKFVAEALEKNVALFEKINKQYKDYYKGNPIMIQKEFLVTLLGDKAANNAVENKSWFERVWKAISDALRSIFSNKSAARVTLSELDWNTKFNDIIDLMTSDDIVQESPISNELTNILDKLEEC